MLSMEAISREQYFYLNRATSLLYSIFGGFSAGTTEKSDDFSKEKSPKRRK